MNRKSPNKSSNNSSTNISNKSSNNFLLSIHFSKEEEEEEKLVNRKRRPVSILDQYNETVKRRSIISMKEKEDDTEKENDCFSVEEVDEIDFSKFLPSLEEIIDQMVDMNEVITTKDINRYESVAYYGRKDLTMNTHIPKPPLNAFLSFLKAVEVSAYKKYPERDLIEWEINEYEKDVAVKKWMNLSNDKKKIYQNLAFEDKLRYEREMNEYKKERLLFDQSQGYPSYEDDETIIDIQDLVNQLIPYKQYDNGSVLSALTCIMYSNDTTKMCENMHRWGC